MPHVTQQQEQQCIRLINPVKSLTLSLCLILFKSKNGVVVEAAFGRFEAYLVSFLKEHATTLYFEKRIYLRHSISTTLISSKVAVYLVWKV